jgi:glutathione S-transferase
MSTHPVDSRTVTESILLYEHPLSPYAQKVRILLREKGLVFDSQTPAAIGSGSDNPSLAQLNPRLEVPALVHEGAMLFDSTIILEYLEERFPAPAMMPAAPAARARMRMIEEVCDTHWEAINWGLGEVRFFGRGGDTLGPVLRAAALPRCRNWPTCMPGCSDSWVTRPG